MKYFIRFVGHVIQQSGLVLPHEVYYDVISDFEHEDLEPTPDGKIGLKQFVNICMLQLLEHGMIVPINPTKMMDGTKLRFDQRMGVSKHVIGYITVIVKALQAPKPVLPEITMFGSDDTTGMAGMIPETVQ